MQAHAPSAVCIKCSALPLVLGVIDHELPGGRPQYPAGVLTPTVQTTQPRSEARHSPDRDSASASETLGIKSHGDGSVLPHRRPSPLQIPVPADRKPSSIERKIRDPFVPPVFALSRRSFTRMKKMPDGSGFLRRYQPGGCKRIPSADPIQVTATRGRCRSGSYHCIRRCRSMPCSGLSPSSLRLPTRLMLKAESISTRLPRR